MGWNEAADKAVAAIDKTIGNTTVTYDFERQMEGATFLKFSEPAGALIGNMYEIRTNRQRIGSTNISDSPIGNGKKMKFEINPW